LVPFAARGSSFFEDGYLGLTQAELRAKLGPPQYVRDRKSALRLFRYYTLADWDKAFGKVLPTGSGEDVYMFRRDGVEVRYSFGFVPDRQDQSDTPTLWVSLVDIEFTPAVPIGKVPSLVPEFRPLDNADAPAFRSNLWVLLFKGPPAPAARAIIREQARDLEDWTLAFQMFAIQGLPDFLTLEATVDRMEIGAQSPQLVRQRQRLTHEPIMNPFSPEFAQRVAPPPVVKKIPMPKYAD
jgi:hypothetical protein